MTKFWWTCSTVLVLLFATEAPAFACSCARILSFQERVQTAPLVVVGRVASAGESPPQVEAASDGTTARPPFMGAGITLAIASVAKGEVLGRQIRIWDLSSGECVNALRGQTIGTSMVIALWPVSDTPAAERATWGAASLVPESDYLAAGACGQSLQVLTSDEVVGWTGRRIQ
jgi:hypothetical protein